LVGAVKSKARDALAERLTRMNVVTLKDKLQDDDLEVRRAAALATAMKEERTLVPRLIEMLTDDEAPVSRAALAALKSLTKQDFGPEAEATRAERDKAVVAWKSWWEKNGIK
jgi:HEAT repeat protein